MKTWKLSLTAVIISALVAGCAEEEFMDNDGGYVQINNAALLSVYGTPVISMMVFNDTDYTITDFECEAEGYTGSMMIETYGYRYLIDRLSSGQSQQATLYFSEFEGYATPRSADWRCQYKVEGTTYSTSGRI